jgi:two-component system sensor histidine kinase VicK
VHHFETKRLTKSHRLLDVSLAISPIKDKQGNIIGLSKIVRDITEKKLEEARKNTFVSMVSHELKTPLTSILAYVQIMLARAKKSNDTFSITALTKTELQARKMALMAQNFLDIGRLEEGKIPVSKERFDLNILIQEIIEDVQLTTPNHKVTYRCSGGLDVYADREKIGQVINNLINNAIKYSPQNPVVTVSCERDENLITIAIKDQGIGISERDQSKLFDRFYRVENEIAGTVPGFGIGLYLVAEILRLHGTSIRVDSIKGVGSTFTFSLPHAKQS